MLTKIPAFTPCLKMEANGNGEWVKVEELEKLEQLNKDMLEVLKEVLIYLSPMPTKPLKPMPSFAETKAIVVKLGFIIAKAEET
jgi:hypothetical protein